jgi:hypothetical protein
MAVAGGQSGGQRPSPPACARPSVTGRHGGAISKPAQDPDAPAATALTCMRPRREQPHQRAVADAGAAGQLAFGVARRRPCISGGHTTVECQPTMQADPHTPCPLRHTMRAPGSRPVARLVWTTSGRLAWRRRHSCNHARKRERGWPRFGSSGRHRRRRPRRRSRSQNPGPPPHHPPIWGTRGGHNFQRAPHRITRRSQIAPPYGPTRGMYSACPSASESPDLQALPMPEEGLEPPTRG